MMKPFVVPTSTVVTYLPLIEVERARPAPVLVSGNELRFSKYSVKAVFAPSESTEPSETCERMT